MPSLHVHSSASVRRACWTCTPRDPKTGRILSPAERAKLAEAQPASVQPAPAELLLGTGRPELPADVADVAALLAACPDCKGSGMLHVEYRNGTTEDRPCRRCEWARKAVGR
jgi:hypothetical protein